MTRGPLPAGVYWRRRAFVLLLAATLVFVIASWLGGGSDAEDDDVPAAQQAGGQTQPSQTITVDRDRKGKGAKARKNGRGPTLGPTFDPSVLVEPEGNCEPADIRIVPTVEEAVAGEPVSIGLNLQTIQADACYFRVGSDKVTVRITRGGRLVWTSRECPDGIPDTSVVVRRAVATLVTMDWLPYPDGKRRGYECPGTDDWLLPDEGFTITAAALGGEPAESDFDLASPPPETITRSPDPKGDRKGDRKGKRGDDSVEQGTAQEEAQGEQPSDRSTDEAR